MLNNKTFIIILALIVSFLAARAMLIAFNLAFAVSGHPVVSLLIRIMLFGIIVILIILKKKENYVYLLFLSVPFYRLSINGVGLLTIIAFMLVVIYHRDIILYFKYGNDIFKIPFIIILFTILITTFLANNKYAAIEKAAYLIQLYFVYIVLTVFYLKNNNILRSFKYLGIVTIFAFIISFYQMIFGVNAIRLFFGEYNQNVWVTREIVRIPSFFVEAQSAGLYFASMAVLFYGLADTYYKNSLWVRIVAILSIIILLFTGTRIAIIAVCSAILFYQITVNSLKGIVKYAAIAMTLIILCGIIYSYILPSAIKERIKKEEVSNSFQFRTKLWQQSIPIIIHNPIGVGLGGENIYEAATKDNVYLTSDFLAVPALRKYTHFENTYLDILYSLGIIGFMGLLLLIFRYLKTVIRMFIKYKDTSDGKFCVFLGALLIIWLICAGTSPKLYDLQAVIFMIIYMSVVNSLYQKYYNKRISERINKL